MYQMIEHNEVEELDIQKQTCDNLKSRIILRRLNAMAMEPGVP